MTGPKYPNQQLRSVSIETFFSGRLDALARMGEVQKLFAEDLPQLFVPQVHDGESAALRPYQLRDVDGDRSLALAMNQATYIAYRYPGFSQFREDALQFLGMSHRTLSVGDLSRVTFMYDNALDVPRASDGELPLHFLFNLDRMPSWLGNAGFSHLDVRWEKPGPTGSLQGHLFTEGAFDQPTLRLVLRATAEPGGAVDKLDDLVSELHRQAVTTFESMVTDDFREFLSVEVVGNE